MSAGADRGRCRGRAVYSQHSAALTAALGGQPLGREGREPFILAAAPACVSPPGRPAGQGAGPSLQGRWVPPADLGHRLHPEPGSAPAAVRLRPPHTLSAPRFPHPPSGAGGVISAARLVTRNTRRIGKAHAACPAPVRAPQGSVRNPEFQEAGRMGGGRRPGCGGSGSGRMGCQAACSALGRPRGGPGGLRWTSDVDFRFY